MNASTTTTTTIIIPVELLASLEARLARIDRGWLAECLAHVKSSSSNSCISPQLLLQQIYELFMQTPLADCAIRVLEKDVQTRIQPCILEIVSILDVGRSAWACVDILQHALDDAKTSSADDGDPIANCFKTLSKSMLKLVLTDGHERRIAFELSPVSSLSIKTPLGTKLSVRNALVSNGVIQLTNKDTTVLGGGFPEADLQLAERLLQTYLQLIEERKEEEALYSTFSFASLGTLHHATDTADADDVEFYNDDSGAGKGLDNRQSSGTAAKRGNAGTKTRSRSNAKAGAATNTASAAGKRKRHSSSNRDGNIDCANIGEHSRHDVRSTECGAQRFHQQQENPSSSRSSFKSKLNGGGGLDSFRSDDIYDDDDLYVEMFDKMEEQERKQRQMQHERLSSGDEVDVAEHDMDRLAFDEVYYDAMFDQLDSFSDKVSAVCNSSDKGDSSDKNIGSSDIGEHRIKDDIDDDDVILVQDNDSEVTSVCSRLAISPSSSTMLNNVLPPISVFPLADVGLFGYLCNLRNSWPELAIIKGCIIEAEISKTSTTSISLLIDDGTDVIRAVIDHDLETKLAAFGVLTGNHVINWLKGLDIAMKVVRGPPCVQVLEFYHASANFGAVLL